MSDPNTDRNLLFGVLALQADLIDAERFAEACSAWAARKSTPLADLMAERGWIAAEERAHVEFLLDRKLRRYGGDARASLAAVADDTAQSVLARIDDPVVQQTLSQLGRPSGHVLVSTIAHTPGTRERYTLTRLHAKGGIGQVWLARDQSLGREVALKELRPERAANPAVMRFHHGQIEAQMQIGWASRRLGRDPEALEAFGQAVDLAEALLAIEPGDADARKQLAQALSLRANLLLTAGRAAEALPMTRRALVIQEALFRDRPETVQFRSILSTVLRSVGRAEAAAGHPAEALAAFERALDLDRPMAKSYPIAHYNLACDLALMIPVADPARREALALQTVETLRQALATGYANVGSLRADPDLDALQQRPDFQALLAGDRSPAGAGE